MAVWLNTHWISRPGVTTWSNGQTGLSNQRWTPVIGRSAKRPERDQGWQTIRASLRNQAQNPVERHGEHDEVGWHELFARAQVHTADRAVVIDRDRAGARGQTDSDVVVAQPALEPGPVKLTQRNQGNFRLKPGPVPQKPIQENLASVADVHLLETLVQGGDEHGCPEQVDRAQALAMSPQPVGKRFARPVVARAGQKRQAKSHAQLVARDRGTWPSGNCRPGETGLARGPRGMREIRPSGPRKTSSRSRRNIVSIPTLRQKSARLVQQAILTCWQLSTSSPVAGSLNELARPPSRGPALEDRDPQAAIDQGRGRRQTGQAAADDHDVGRGGFSKLGHHAANAPG